MYLFRRDLKKSSSTEDAKLILIKLQICLELMYVLHITSDIFLKIFLSQELIINDEIGRDLQLFFSKYSGCQNNVDFDVLRQV